MFPDHERLSDNHAYANGNPESWGPSAKFLEARDICANTFRGALPTLDSEDKTNALRYSSYLFDSTESTMRSRRQFDQC